MARYTHHFDISITNNFDSDIEDFEEALEAWLGQFTSTEETRTSLLFTDESTKSIIKCITHNDTVKNEEVQP